METSLANIFLGNPSAPLQGGTQTVHGSGTDSDAFLSVLQNTMKGVSSKEVSSSNILLFGEAGTATDSASSTDELARSLDIIDALAFLPVLLASQAQKTAGTDGGQNGQAYSSATISDLLEAISNALETGNTGDVLKTLESDQNLRSLLSGQAENGSKGLEGTAGASALSALMDRMTSMDNGKTIQTEGATLTGLASLTALMDRMARAGNGQSSGKGKGSTVSSGAASSDALAALMQGMTGTDGASGDITDEALASIVAALEAEVGKERVPASGKEEKAAPLTPATRTEGTNEDVVRNTMLLGAILPNLLTVKSEAVTAEGQAGTPGLSEAALSTLASITQGIKTGGTDGSQAKKGSDTGKTAATTLPGNQSTARSGLSEDYVLLNESTKGQDKIASTRTAGPFEVLFSAENAAKDAADTETMAPVINLAEGVKNVKAGAGDRNLMADGRVEQAKQASGQDQGLAGGLLGTTASQDETLTEDLDLTNRIGSVTAAAGKASAMDHEKGETKKGHAENLADSSVPKGEANPYSGDASVKTHASQGKEYTSGLEKGSYASLMIDKIEEIAATYAGRSQSADLVIRLDISEKESLLVGMKEQGNKIIVEVKGASEGLANNLQLHKDAIMRELENKHIYATIHVNTTGEDSSRRNPRQRQGREGSERTQEEFGSIFNTLA